MACLFDFLVLSFDFDVAFGELLGFCSGCSLVCCIHVVASAIRRRAAVTV
jgi:hypothetical protein